MKKNSYEAFLKNPNLEHMRYYIIKDFEKNIWRRKNWKESNRP